MSKPSFWTRWIANKVLLAVVITLLVCGGAFGIYTHFSSESKTLKIGFENIGEMVTQVVNATEVNVTDKVKEWYGFTIPFTQSKYIYSYDISIKAGFNFEEIEWKKRGKTIEVILPQIKILSSEIDYDSFKVYHEQESVFTRITLDENNQSMVGLKEKAEQDAIANGLFENARANAETILKGFFGQEYDLEEYKLVFQDK